MESHMGIFCGPVLKNGTYCFLLPVLSYMDTLNSKVGWEMQVVVVSERRENEFWNN